VRLLCGNRELGPMNGYPIRQPGGVVGANQRGLLQWMQGGFTAGIITCVTVPTVKKDWSTLFCSGSVPIDF
jgi:hypothetical protein